MPTIVTATELRTILGVSSSLYSDAYLDDICDASENIVIPMLVTFQSKINKVKLESGYSSALTNSQPDLNLPETFFVSSKPTLSALIHLCLNPSGAGGASRDDGGVQTLGLSVLVFYLPILLQHHLPMTFGEVGQQPPRL